MLEKLKRNLNLILIVLLMLTMAVASFANQRRAERQSSAVSLPVTRTDSSGGAVETYREQRESEDERELSALETLSQQDALDVQTREDAAALLQQLVARREQQSALEKALNSTALAPCVAVVGDGCVTVVTQQASVTSAQTALVMSRARAHAGVEPSGVQVIVAGGKK